MRHLADLLKREQPEWEAQYQRLQQVMHLLEPVCPPELQGRFRIGRLLGASLVLATPSSAVAGRLRQLLPRFARQLAQHGWPPLELKIEIDTLQTTAPRPAQRKLSAHAEAALQDLASRLPEGELKHAVQRLHDDTDHAP